MLTRWIYAYFKVVFAYPAKTQVMVGTTQRKQGLHDVIAGTLVICESNNRAAEVLLSSVVSRFKTVSFQGASK